jgi:hypothetical protein
MSKRARVGALVALNAMLLAGPASAAEDSAVLKDLTAVIALQGQPCGQVVTVARQSENDYIASCQDGNRYRVFVSSQGRVVVQKQ